ncbi:hypothetical protein [Streptomyces griseus]|uniref:hypothetical protein n=1 Tax=Streptomyces griseus TaxID=1911 RepID=UPI0008947D6E|nr:hypothetical protein [Streptomyces griseus]SEE24003.1 hypothetical protein SAMN04490359_2335 [Streptomyces griseus]SQA21905.1 Uncharacterised protein [Streptomyces griseus]
MIIGDLSARLAAARGRLIIELSRAVTDWGGQVPEDPGVAELADLLEDAAATLRTISSSTRAELAGAVGHLRAADRLGGLLPAVTLWHLRQALQRSAPSRIPEDLPPYPADRHRRPAEPAATPPSAGPHGLGPGAGGMRKRFCGEPCPPGG